MIKIDRQCRLVVAFDICLRSDVGWDCRNAKTRIMQMVNNLIKLQMMLSERKNCKVMQDHDNQDEVYDIQECSEAPCA